MLPNFVTCDHVILSSSFYSTLDPAGNLSVFFFNYTATTEIYTLSLHDALPILTIGQEFNRATTFKVHQNGAVGLPLFPGPIINAQNAHSLRWNIGDCTHVTKQRWASHLHAKLRRKPLTHFTTGGKAERLERFSQAISYTCIRLHQFGKSLRKNRARAG